MPRRDPTFTDLDLIRFFCKNLDPGEKYWVLKTFADYVRNGKKICPDDPDKRVDPCEWIKFARKVISECSDANKLLRKLIPIIGSIAGLLHYGAYAGPWGRILIVVRIAFDFFLEFFIFITAVMTLISEMTPFIDFLDRFFCKGEAEIPGLDYQPPGMNLPESPERRMDRIMKAVEEAFEWLEADDTDLPPDMFPPPGP
ncbi:MAG: hypothetical protein P9F19_01990 [Candidatus Contendobacter sp.]|nr:hypothetical protein [Candidatus Contendobacter sp.]MDG4556161.1 hypothetical protein [Candidatus Contendobacter sp.]